MRLRTPLPLLLAAALPVVATAQPTVTITSPAPYEVARPFVHVVATANCGGTCSSMSVHVANQATIVTVPGTSSVDVTISLDAWEGQQVAIAVTANMPGYPAAYADRPVLVESDAHLVKMDSVLGRIMDFDATRILYLDSQQQLVIYDRATMATTTIENPDNVRPGTFPAYLTSHGCIFIAGTTFNTQLLREWRDGVLTTFASFPASDFAVNGHYAIWRGYAGVAFSGPLHVYVRDLDAGVTTDVPYAGTGTIESGAHVAEDGTVAFPVRDSSTNMQNVFLYRTSVQQLTFTGSNSGPSTDGTETLYIKAGTPPELVVNDGSTEEHVANRSLSIGSIDQEYQIRNGWIAAILEQGQVKVPYLFFPTGETQQLSLFNSSSFIEYLSANGDVTITNPTANQRLLRTSTAAPYKIGSTLGRAKPLGSQWFVAVGNSVFSIGDGSPGTTTTLASSLNPSATGETVTFTATIFTNVGTPTGTVIFREGNTILLTATVSGGTAQYTTSSLATGTHNITAAYSGDAQHVGSASNTVAQVVKTATTTTLSTSLNPSIVGESVTFTAVVNSGSIGSIVDFKDGNTVLSSVGLEYVNSQYQASFTTAALSAGVHSMTAYYRGDSGLAASTSNVVMQQVNAGFGPPPNVSATAVGTTSVTVTWSPVSGANHYDVYRSSNNSSFGFLASTAATSYSDTNVSAATTYLYKLRAVDGSANATGFSAVDLATTIVFTDDPLVAGQTVVKAVHFTEARTAVNAVRAAAGLTPITFTHTVAPGALIYGTEALYLRTALAEARNVIGVPPISWENPGAGTFGNFSGVPIRTPHIQQVRDGCK
jgi:hypothetical protein